MKIPTLYKQYYIDKHDERRDLFRELAERFQPRRGLYAGSFVHITPSFYLPDMTYVDSDRRIERFFADDAVAAYIEEQKNYQEIPRFTGIQADFTADLPLEEESIDLLFSFYAGFVSRECKRYLKPGGFLVCNNSHGDASLALLDPDYRLCGVVKRSGERFRLVEDELSTYGLKRDGTPIDEAKVLRRMIGENFTRKVYAYLFVRNP